MTKGARISEELLEFNRWWAEQSFSGSHIDAAYAAFQYALSLNEINEVDYINVDVGIDRRSTDRRD